MEEYQLDDETKKRIDKAVDKLFEFAKEALMVKISQIKDLCSEGIREIKKNNKIHKGEHDLAKCVLNSMNENIFWLQKVIELESNDVIVKECHEALEISAIFKLEIEKALSSHKEGV